MTSVVTGQPPKFERLVHVDSLHWYDGELLGHYTIDGEPWLVSWTNFKNLGTQYWEAHAYFPISPDNLKKLLDNKITLRDAMELATEMWRLETTWDHENGVGIKDTHVSVWTPATFATWPQDELPTDMSYVVYDKPDGGE